MYQCIETQQMEDVTVLRISGVEVRGRLISDELPDELDQLSQQQQSEKLVVSLGKLNCVTSDVINALIKLRGRLIAAGGSIGLCAMKTTVRDSFRLMNLDGTLFAIHDTEAEAINAARATAPGGHS